EGNVGAGTGATVGKFLGPANMMKSGLGTYAVQIGRLQVSAIVAVNALGDIIDLDSGKRLAGILNEDHKTIGNTEEIMYAQYEENRNIFNGNTTIGCIVTNARLTKSQANKLASIAQNGLARSIRPVHTMADGDTVFALATGEVDVLPDAVGALATEVMARAINRAVLTAKSAYGLKAACDFIK
ncbi:MAG: P1 family peptidase, partial [Anaerovorax sp.]|nr:P1 family peptidase [Anaerovorax sp.]